MTDCLPEKDFVTLWFAQISNILAMLIKSDTQTTVTVYFKGGKSCQKLIKKKRENIFHRYSPRGNPFQTGIVPVVRYSHSLPKLSINCSKIVNANHPIKIKHFHVLSY